MGGEWSKVELGGVIINHDGKRKPVKESERRPGHYPYYVPRELSITLTVIYLMGTIC